MKHNLLWILDLVTFGLHGECRRDRSRSAKWVFGRHVRRKEGAFEIAPSSPKTGVTATLANVVDLDGGEPHLYLNSRAGSTSIDGYCRNGHNRFVANEARPLTPW